MWKKEVVCSGKIEEDGKTYEVRITGTLDNNKVSAVKASMIFNSFAEDDSKKIDYKCDGTTLTIEKYQNMADSEDESPIGKTKEEFIELMTKDSDDKVTCN